MGYSFNNDTPIYLQIIDYIKQQIISKKYKPNEKIPSVREYALMFEVNPNTIQKALQELEEMGLIYTESTNGKFVTTDDVLILKVAKQTINEEIDKFYKYMEKLGLSREEVNKIISNKE